MNLNDTVLTTIRRNTLWLLRLMALWLYLVSIPSYANPLAGYCITKEGQKPPPVEVRPFNQPRQRPEQIEIQFTFKNNIYRLRSYRSDITLFDAENNQLGEVFARQRDGGSIEHLQLVAEDLLWINGSKMDYLVRLNLNQSPIRFGALEAIDLTPKPYSKIVRFFFTPDFRSHGQFSRVLNRLFITGHRTTLFGTADPVATEWVNGQPRPLPKALYDTVLDKELPQLNGALFRGRSVQGDPLEAYNKAFFYDGVKATPLLKGYINEEVKNRGWTTRISPFSKRVFLSHANANKSFLVELIAEGQEIILPENLAGVMFYEFPEDFQLFVTTTKNLLAEVSGKFKAVVNVIPPLKMDPYLATHELWRTKDFLAGPIELIVYNPLNKINTSYFLVHSSPNAKCFAGLDPDKPIELKAE